jgi:hypothetical protein
LLEFPRYMTARSLASIRNDPKMRAANLAPGSFF